MSAVVGHPGGTIDFSVGTTSSVGRGLAIGLRVGLFGCLWGPLVGFSVGILLRLSVGLSVGSFNAGRIVGK